MKNVRNESPQRWRRWISTRSMQVFSLALLVVAAISPPQGLGFDICVMRVTTDLPCPGCGVTRSMTLLMHGRLAESCQMNPLGGVILLALIVIVAIGFVPPSPQDEMSRTRTKIRAAGRVAALGIVLMMAALWFWRLFETVSQGRSV